MNKKGFTLIEIIGVIVIIGLILMIVFPTLSKLMTNNNIKKYDNYYLMIDEAAKVYASTMHDKMGPSTQSGCAEFSLNDLILKNYLQEYNDKNTSCEMVTANIRVKNNKGKITTYFQLKCSDDNPNTPDYIKGTEDIGNCIAYARTEQNSLYQTIKSSITNISKDGNTVYVTNNPTNTANKYIYYSGNIWKIVSYDEMQETIRVVSNSSVTVIPYSVNNSNAYINSTVAKWLETVYLPNLKNTDEFLILANYDTSPSANFDNPITSVPEKLIKSKIGLLPAFEARKIRQASGTTVINRWLMSEGNANYNMFHALDTVVLAQRASNLYAHVYPVISFNSNIKVLQGTGTLSNPYVIEQDFKGETGTLLNTRPAGEYVYLNYNSSNVKFRISGLDREGNVRATYHVNENKAFDEDYYDFSFSTLATHLNTTEYNKFSSSSKALMVDGYFCSDVLNSSNLADKENLFTTDCSDQSKLKMFKIGLYKLGEMYPTQSVSSKVWTMNPFTALDDSPHSTINVLSGDGSVSDVGVSTSVGITYNMVVTLSKTVTIFSGDGTLESPYVIK